MFKFDGYISLIRFVISSYNMEQDKQPYNAVQKSLSTPLNTTDSLLSFSGTDACSFLQGQTTNDVAALNSGNSQFGALCNPKGRVISLFYLSLQDNIYYMTIPKALCASLLKRLTMFVFRADVKINDVSSQYKLRGESNDTKHKNTQAPFSKFSVNQKPTLTISVTNTTADNTTNDTLNTDWQLTLINAGIPRITEATSELFLPQMLNLDALAGISFTKGCYTGQEVVARLHYKGTVKRRLYRYKSALLIGPGTNLFIKDQENSSGTIVDCLPIEESGFIGTVVFKTDAFSPKPLTFEQYGDISLSLPPYELDSIS